MLPDAGMDWGSEELKQATTRYNSWFKVRQGTASFIRVVSPKCYPVFKHQWFENGFRTTMCSMAEHGSCPVCAIGGTLKDHKRNPAFAAVVVHIVDKRGSETAKPVLKLLAWRFADQTKTELESAHELMKARGGLNHTDLKLILKEDTAEGEKFQKTSIMPCPDPIIPQLPADCQTAIVNLLKDKEAIAAVMREFYPRPEDVAKWVKMEKAVAAKEGVADVGFNLGAAEQPPWQTATKPQSSSVVDPLASLLGGAT